MNDEAIRLKMNGLACLLEEANKAYYIDDESVMTDSDYDAKFRLLLSLEELHPSLRDPNSPTSKVGGETVTEHARKKHETPMLSLENGTNDTDIENFIGRVMEHSTRTMLYMDEKMDGASLELTYEFGNLVSAVTRGKKGYGDEVFHNAKAMLTVPKHIYQLVDTESYKVRGEAVMPKAAFERYNKLQSELGKPALANPRNAVAGAIKRKNSKSSAQRNLAFYAFGDPNAIANYRTQAELMKRLEEFGFLTPVNYLVEADVEAVRDALDRLEKIRPERPYDIDGMVIKVNDLETQADMGLRTASPTWALAYKYAAVEESTIIIDVIFQVGRTGKITPVVIVTPTLIDGSVVSRVTCSNISEMRRKGIAIGATCFIRKSGDVIPEIMKVIDDGHKLMQAPTNCPCCDSELEVVTTKNSEGIVCNNVECPDRLASTLTYLASREVLNINGLGDSTAAKLVETNAVTDVVDLLFLSADYLVDNNVAGNKEAMKLSGELNNLKNNLTLEKVLLMLCIPGVSTNNAAMLSDWADGDIQNLIGIDMAKLTTIEGIGPKTAAGIHLAFNDDEVQLINFCKAPGAIKRNEISTKYFDGMRFAFTGKFDTIDRRVEEAFIKKHGGRSGTTINHDTILVKGTGGGAKATTAAKVGATVIDETKYIELRDSKIA